MSEVAMMVSFVVSVYEISATVPGCLSYGVCISNVAKAAEWSKQITLTSTQCLRTFSVYHLGQGWVRLTRDQKHCLDRTLEARS